MTVIQRDNKFQEEYAGMFFCQGLGNKFKTILLERDPVFTLIE